MYKIIVLVAVFAASVAGQPGGWFPVYPPYDDQLTSFVDTAVATGSYFQRTVDHIYFVMVQVVSGNNYKADVRLDNKDECMVEFSLPFLPPRSPSDISLNCWTPRYP